MLETYRKHVAERAAEGVVAKPLDAEQVAALVELLVRFGPVQEEPVDIPCPSFFEEDWP